MKRLLFFLFAVCTQTSWAAVAAYDIQVPQRDSANTKWVSRNVTVTANSVIGLDSNKLPIAYTAGSGITINGTTGQISSSGGGGGGLSSTDIDTSAELAAILTDETGSGTGALLVFNIDPIIRTPNAAMGALAIDVTKRANTFTATATTHTFTFSGTPSTGAVFGVVITGYSSDCVFTIPSSFSLGLGTTRTTFTVPANSKAEITWRYDGTTYFMAGEPVSIADLSAVTVASGDKIPVYDVSTGLEGYTTAGAIAALASGGSSAPTVNPQTGTTYTLVLGDANNIVTMTNASSNTLTIPPNSSVAFPTGTIILVGQLGAGATSVAPGSGVTINGASSTVTMQAQYTWINLVKTGTDAWQVYGGDLVTTATLNGYFADPSTNGSFSASAWRTDLVLATSDSPQFAGINLGHASDTTLSRSAAGVLAVEGNNVITTTGVGQKDVWLIPIGDETTAITTGTAKVTFRAPYACTVTAVRASLTTASSSGIPTFDINEAGTTILSTKLTVDASELTSTTAATAAVISDSSIADDAQITIDVDVAGTGAAGAKIAIYVTRT